MPKTTDELLQEVVDKLTDLVKDNKDILNFSKEIEEHSRQTFLQLTYGGSASHGGGAREGARSFDWRTLIHGPENRIKEKYVNPAAGIGGYVRNLAKGIWRGSKTRRYMKTGRKIGTGIGKSLGMGAQGTRMLAGIGAAAGAAVAVAGAFIAVAAAVWEAYKAIDQYTDAAMREAKRLSEVSGSMAAITAERDIQQMMRDLRKGEATAGSTRALMQGEARRKEQENRLDIVITNATNSILAVLNNGIANVLAPIADLVESIAEKFKVFEGPAKPAILGDLMDSVMKAADKIDREGKTLMDVAREAGRREAGVGPAGAAPGGFGPGGRPMLP